MHPIIIFGAKFFCKLSLLISLSTYLDGCLIRSKNLLAEEKEKKCARRVVYVAEFPNIFLTFRIVGTLQERWKQYWRSAKQSRCGREVC